MVGAGLVAAFLALPAERRSLEEVAVMRDDDPRGPPLTPESVRSGS